MQPSRRRGAFLLWCAGAVELNFLEDLATERTRYISLALAMLAPMSVGFAGMCNASFAIAANWPLSVTSGALWAVIVFVIDRALLVSFRHPLSPPGVSFGRVAKTFAGYLSLFATRAAIAILVGVIISHSILILIFHSEEVGRLSDEAVERMKIIDASYDAKFSAIRDQDKVQAQSLKELEEERRTTEQDRNRETAGKGLSGRYGAGPARQDLNDTLHHLEDEIRSARTVYQAQQQDNKRKLAQLTNERDEERSLAQKNQAHGYMARAKALEALVSGSAELRWARRTLFAFFVMLELVPLIIKAILVNGPYAKRVALSEWRAVDSIRIEYSAHAATGQARLNFRKAELLAALLDTADPRSTSTDES